MPAGPLVCWPSWAFLSSRARRPSDRPPVHGASPCVPVSPWYTDAVVADLGLARLQRDPIRRGPVCQGGCTRVLGVRTKPQEFGGCSPTCGGVGAHGGGPHQEGLGAGTCGGSRDTGQGGREQEPEPAAPHTARSGKETRPACNRKGAPGMQQEDGRQGQQCLRSKGKLEAASTSGSAVPPVTQNPELLPRPVPHLPSLPGRKDRPPTTSGSSTGGFQGLRQRGSSCLPCEVRQEPGLVLPARGPPRPALHPRGSDPASVTLTRWQAPLPRPSLKLTLPIFHYRTPSRRQLPVPACGSGLQGRD